MGGGGRASPSGWSRCVMNHQIGALVTANEQAVGALNTMVTTWQLLGTQFNAVIDRLQNNTKPDDGPFLVAELETGKTDWDDVATTASLINTQCGTLPVQSTTNSTLRLAS
jgi:hypothetical protein